MWRDLSAVTVQLRAVTVYKVALRAVRDGRRLARRVPRQERRRARLGVEAGGHGVWGATRRDGGGTQGTASERAGSKARAGVCAARPSPGGNLSS